MNTSADNQELLKELKKQSAGNILGIISLVFAVLGIFTLGFVFVPIAFILALIGLIVASKNKNTTGIIINIIAFLLVIVGLFTSPVLLAIILTPFGIAAGTGA